MMYIQTAGAGSSMSYKTKDLIFEGMVQNSLEG